MPVIFPAGLFKLLTRPSLIGSMLVVKTIGIVSGHGLGCDRRRSIRGNHCHPSANEVSRQRRQPIIMALCPPELDRKVLAFDIAGLRKAATETGHEWFVLLGRCRIEEPDHGHCRLLRAHRQRPRGCRAAEQRYECAPLHSITSSARASSVGGTSSPSARAVGRLMMKSNLVDCTTGRSVGLLASQ